MLLNQADGWKNTNNMKAQILKIAGVKTEKEFYKKFPTEAAFMKKHGKQLKKAVDGDQVADDAFDYMNQLPSDYQATDLSNIGQNAFGGINKFINSDFGTTTKGKTKKAFDYNKVLDPLTTQLGTIVGSAQQLNQQRKDLKDLDMYAQVAENLRKVGMPEQIKKKYVRPEDQLSQTVNPLGIGTDYLAAKNGAEIANYYTSPNTIYTDGGFEPLNDSNVKQYKKGGKLKKAVAGAGVNWNMFSGKVGGIGGALGSAIGGGTGRGGAASSIGSTVGSIGGSLIGGPLGGIIGEAAGGTIGGIVDSFGQNELQQKQDKFYNAMNTATLQGQIGGVFQENKAFVKDGGWVSHDWQPQVIASFGEHKLKDLLKPPHDADMLRAGGHLKYYTPPTERAMDTGKAEYGSQMAFGGDIKVANGYMKPLSDDVQKLIGPSHKEGGMPFANGGNLIEAEGDETVMKTYADGGNTDDGSVTIFGNRFISKDAAEFAGVKPGRKYKKESEELALNQTKFENKATKNFADADDMQVDDMFSQIEQRTKLLNGKAFTAKADDAKSTLKKLAAYQNETDDIARSQGLEINAFDKGIAKPIKESDMAKFGAKLETADRGKNLSNIQPALTGLLDLLYRKGYDVGNVSGKRSGKTATGKQSRHNIGEAIDVAFPKLGSKTYDTITKDPEIVDYLVQNGLTAINEYDPKVRSKTGGTAGHIHFGYDKGTAVADKFRKKFDPNTQIPGNNFGDNWNNERQIWQPNNMFPAANKLYDNSPPADSWTDDGSRYWKPILGVPTEFTNGNEPISVQGDSWNQDADGSNIWAPNLGIPTTFPNPKTRTGLLGKDYDPGYNEQPFWKPRNIEYTPSGPLTETRTVTEAGKKSNAVQKAIVNTKGKTVAPTTSTVNTPNGMTALRAQGTPAGKYDWNNQLANIRAVNGEPTSVDPRTTGWDGTDDYQQISPDKTLGTASTDTTGTNNINQWGKRLTNTLGSLAPFLRPSNARPLDPSQLAGEMYALSTNQLEPVQAQLYSPMLQAQPYRISLQDQLNEVTAQSRAAERMAQGNPAALAMIAGQAQQAKSKILGEQFRMNQGEAVRAAETNRAQWNEAQQKNLGILDQQYARQSEARSKTRTQNIEALKSIAAKQAQNKLENRTLGTYENLYNYRFGPEGQAYSLNAPYNFNIPDVGYGASSVNEIGGGRSAKELRAIADLQEEASKKATKATPAGNGAIVKAIKNL
jgi:hypothetical protein